MPDPNVTPQESSTAPVSEVNSPAATSQLAGSPADSNLQKRLQDMQSMKDHEEKAKREAQAVVARMEAELRQREAELNGMREQLSQSLAAQAKEKDELAAQLTALRRANARHEFLNNPENQDVRALQELMPEHLEKPEDMKAWADKARNITRQGAASVLTAMLQGSTPAGMPPAAVSGPPLPPATELDNAQIEAQLAAVRGNPTEERKKLDEIMAIFRQKVL